MATSGLQLAWAELRLEYLSNDNIVKLAKLRSKRASPDVVDYLEIRMAVALAELDRSWEALQHFRAVTNPDGPWRRRHLSVDFVVCMQAICAVKVGDYAETERISDTAFGHPSAYRAVFARMRALASFAVTGDVEAAAFWLGREFQDEADDQTRAMLYFAEIREKASGVEDALPLARESVARMQVNRPAGDVPVGWSIDMMLARSILVRMLCRAGIADEARAVASEVDPATVADLAHAHVSVAYAMAEFDAATGQPASGRRRIMEALVTAEAEHLQPDVAALHESLMHVETARGDREAAQAARQRAQSAFELCGDLGGLGGLDLAATRLGL